MTRRDDHRLQKANDYINLCHQMLDEIKLNKFDSETQERYYKEIASILQAAANRFPELRPTLTNQFSRVP